MLAAKYSFLFKKRDEMTPAERRWKWVKKTALPKDLVELMDKLQSNKKTKKEKVKQQVTTEQSVDQVETQGEFVTQLRARNDIDVDYTDPANVKERLEYLKKDRIKGKYSADYHVRVLNLMHEKLPDREENTTMKVEVLLLLIGTLF